MEVNNSKENLLNEEGFNLIKLKQLTVSLIKGLFAIAMLLFFIGVGQMSQYLGSSQDIRLHTIEEWKQNNPGDIRLADKFVSECLIGLPPEESLPLPPPISIYDCGKSINAGELVKKIRESDSVLKTTAWPLSIVAE